MDQQVTETEMDNGQSLHKPAIRPWSAIVKIMATVIVAEILIMLLFANAPMPELGMLELALVDGIVLGILVAPVLYYTLLVPLKIRMLDEQNIRLVLHDPLTGLPRMELFREMVRHEIHIANRQAYCVGLLIIDPARLTEINQVMGHKTGDRILQQVAKRIGSAVRDSDSIARLSGDEFGVLLHYADIEQLMMIEAKVRKAIGKPFIIDGQKVHINSVSGAAVFPDHASEADDLIKRAGMALNRAKQEQSPCGLFHAEDESAAHLRIKVFGALREAIKSEQLELYYQPKVALESGQVAGVEALVRWPGEHGRPPDEFIPLAEQTGLIHELTRWVVKAATAQCRQWMQQGLHIPVSINISAQNLYHLDIVELLVQSCQEQKVSASMITIEVTESSLMEQPQVAIERLVELRENGFKISLDDFGTGYSSLAYLKNIPANELKLDQSFVTHVVSDKNDEILVRSVIKLAHDLGLSTIAEGVETADVLEKLRQLGCEMVQGYYFSRPLDADAYLEWHKQNLSRN